jgi:tetratricopeptide (TPR) repeat protein
LINPVREQNYSHLTLLLPAGGGNYGAESVGWFWKSASWLSSSGASHAMKGKFDRAFAFFDEAIWLDPKYADAFYDRGVAHAQIGGYDRALSDFDAAIRLNPKNADFFANRGSAYLVKGRRDRAVADYDEAIRLCPNHALAIRGKIIAARDDLHGADPNTIIKAAAVVAMNDAVTRTHLGRLTRIRTEDGSVATLSMIRWGMLRRGLARVMPWLLLTRFIPRYEIAIYDGRVGLKPYLTIFYVDQETALKGWNELARIIESFGLMAACQLLSGLADSRKEAWLSGVKRKKMQAVCDADAFSKSVKTDDAGDDFEEVVQTKWFCLQNTKGERRTYFAGDGEITIMRNGAPQKMIVKSTSFDPQAIGSTITLRHNNTGEEDVWTVDHARLDEIAAANASST